MTEHDSGLCLLEIDNNREKSKACKPSRELTYTVNLLAAV